MSAVVVLVCPQCSQYNPAGQNVPSNARPRSLNFPQLIASFFSLVPTFLKPMAYELEKIVPFSDVMKVDVQPDGLVRTFGISTQEKPDKDGEICVYDDAVKQYTVWSDAFERATKAAGQEISKGNVHIMPSGQMGGKVTDLTFDAGSWRRKDQGGVRQP
jgi:hypothetical protein